MSVLVWDGKTLAADSYGNNGDTCFPVVKIWKDHNALFGAVGGVQAVSALREWIKEQMLTDFPQEARLNKAQMLMITPTDFTRYNGSPIPIRLPPKTQLAIGEGAPYAYGALHMGATAEQAVAAAIKYSVHCNGEPVSVSME